MSVRAVLAFLLLSLSALSLVSSTANVTLSAATPQLGAVGGGLRFDKWEAVEGENPPWPGRRMAYVCQLPFSVTFMNKVTEKQQTLPTPFILAGGFDPAWDSVEYNDIWLSRDAKTCQRTTIAPLAPPLSLPVYDDSSAVTDLDRPSSLCVCAQGIWRRG